MSYDDDDDFDNDDDNNGSGDGIKDLRQANRKMAKQLKELTAENSTLKSSNRLRSVKDAIQAKGLNPKIAALLPADLGTDEAAIETWLDEYGDLFGPAVVTDAPTGAPGEKDQGTLSPDALASQRISAAQAGGKPADANDLDLLMSQVASAQSPEELTKLLFGSANGPRSAF